ncbi:MAG: MBL fold metallo-hydrolase, partial [Pseudolysinimonas sp.]
GPMLGFFMFAMRKGGLRMPAITKVERMNDGDVLPLPGSPTIIGMPGHSPGSVAIHVPAVRAVFVGDELTTRNVLSGVEGPQPAPFTDDQAESSRSLDRLAELDLDWIIPGHGAPWTAGAPALMAAYRAAETR